MPLTGLMQGGSPPMMPMMPGQGQPGQQGTPGGFLNQQYLEQMRRQLAMLRPPNFQGYGGVPQGGIGYQGSGPWPQGGPGYVGSAGQGWAGQGAPGMPQRPMQTMHNPPGLGAMGGGFPGGFGFGSFI
jgi:hypothetical protein